MPPTACARKLLPIGLLLTALFFTGCFSKLPRDYDIREGDILFQSLPRCELVDTIEDATYSSFSHCGIVAKTADELVVIEAIGPVRETPISSWIGQGRGNRFSAYRLAPEFAAKIPAILSAARGYLGKPYDIHYRFDDDRIYCSELIFKAFRTVTGKNLGKVEKLGDLNWKPHEKFIRSIEGYVPVEREMITPQAMSEAPELTKVYERKR
ncbi:MAG: hypothetical protein HZA31_01690 [Opitutae bacterium]|nr:hypothetical protein [Opitutae bacterium]